MRRVVVVLAVLLLTSLTVGDALAIQYSRGLVQVRLLSNIRIADVGRAKVKVEGISFDLRVDYDMWSLDGRFGELSRPVERQVDTGFSFRIPLLTDKATDKKVVTKIPILGDVPIVGDLFRTKDETEDLMGLMVLVTPTLLTPVEKTEKEPVELGGAVDIATYKASGKVSIHKKFTFYKGKVKLKVSGTIKLKFSGPRAG